jgi:hypothetical protein
LLVVVGGFDDGYGFGKLAVEHGSASAPGAQLQGAEVLWLVEGFFDLLELGYELGVGHRSEMIMYSAHAK